MSLAAAGDAVGHSGQAVTLPVARGQHLFSRTRRFPMNWARERGLAGLYRRPRVRVKVDDVAVASDHGRALLEYVPADLPQTA